MNEQAQPNQRIDGQVAVVTGGSRGIGFAAAQELGRLGASLVLIGRDGPRSEEAARTLRSEGIDAVGHGCDVSRASELQGLVQELGPQANADILVVSAGVMSERMAKTLRTTPEEWDRVMGINLNGAFYAISAFVPGMAERRRGRVITVSACLGRFSGPGTNGGLAPYRVSKAALNALTKNLAAELQLGARGVLVDAMCPNHCRTDMGGPEAPRSAQEGADTIVWLATRADRDAAGKVAPTGLLWEDREVIPW